MEITKYIKLKISVSENSTSNCGNMCEFKERYGAKQVYCNIYNQPLEKSNFFEHSRCEQCLKEFGKGE